MNGAAWSRVRAMVRKEFLAVLRDRRSRITLVLPPILQLVLFGFATTLEVKNITLGIYDLDHGAWSQEIVDRLAGSPNVRRLVRLDSPQAVEQAIDDRRVIAVVSFGQTFSADITAHRPAVVQAAFDGRRSNASQIVGGYLTEIVASVGAEVRASPMQAGGSTVVTNWFNPNLDYLWFTMPGLVVMIAALSVLSVTAQSVARERELGTFDQLLVSPLRVHEILIGKVAPALALGVFNATVYAVLLPFVFKVPFAGSVLLFYMALVCYLVALIGVGLLVSILSQTQQQAFLGMFLSTVPLIMLSGYAAPVDNMPGWLQVIAQGDPLKHFLIISEGVFLKDMPAGEVLANTWPLILIAAVTLTGSALFFRSRLE
ncbi:MAG: ABC transporter permease [Steroidobacterales bacterium]